MTRVALRKAAAEGGAPFTDARLGFPEWAAVKATGYAPLGQLPVLEAEGHMFTQSVPMSAYAAKKAGLYPTEPLAQLGADEIVAVIDELWNKIAATSKDAPATRLAYAEETAPVALKYVAKRLAESSTPFFQGAATPQWADLWVYQYVK